MSSYLRDTTLAEKAGMRAVVYQYFFATPTGEAVFLTFFAKPPFFPQFS
jgi:hypothetical protein